MDAEQIAEAQRLAIIHLLEDLLDDVPQLTGPEPELLTAGAISMLEVLLGDARRCRGSFKAVLKDWQGQLKERGFDREKGESQVTELEGAPPELWRAYGSFLMLQQVEKLVQGIERPVAGARPVG